MEVLKEIGGFRLFNTAVTGILFVPLFNIMGIPHFYNFLYNFILLVAYHWLFPKRHFWLMALFIVQFPFYFWLDYTNFLHTIFILMLWFGYGINRISGKSWPLTLFFILCFIFYSLEPQVIMAIVKHYYLWTKGLIHVF
jgi:hypothetical protein